MTLEQYLLGFNNFVYSIMDKSKPVQNLTGASDNNSQQKFNDKVNEFTQLMIKKENELLYDAALGKQINLSSLQQQLKECETWHIQNFVEKYKPSTQD